MVSTISPGRTYSHRLEQINLILLKASVQLFSTRQRTNIKFKKSNLCLYDMAYKLAVVYGGCGALGRVFVSKLKLSGAYEVISIDFTPSAEADNNVLVTELSDWSRQSSDVIGQLDKVVGKRRNIDLIACVAGGWAGGSAAELDVVKNSDLMWKQSVWSSLICAQICK